MLFFVAVTALFLDFTGTIHAWLGWTAKVQFLPALLAVNAGVVALLVLLTLLAGRVYCSVICPLGVMQDIVSWISGRRKKKKYRFSYSPEVKWLRYGVLGLFVIALIAGVGSFVALLAPYSSYGRIATNLFAPVYRWGNNLLAYFAERADSYAFYETEVWLKSLPTFLIAAVTFVVLITLAWRNGRTYCNTICPVGTVLGFFSRDRCGEMQELQFVFPWMQGCLHRLQEPSHRLQPLRSVHGLYRHLQTRCASVGIPLEENE